MDKNRGRKSSKESSKGKEEKKRKHDAIMSN